MWATEKSVEELTDKLQEAVNATAAYTKLRHVRLNEKKSTSLIRKKINKIKQLLLLGMSPDAKLWWKMHVKKKRDEINMKFRKIQWFWDEGRYRRSTTSYLYTCKFCALIGPMELYGCARKCNTKISKQGAAVQRCTVNAPWYSRKTYWSALKTPDGESARYH